MSLSERTTRTTPEGVTMLCLIICLFMMQISTHDDFINSSLPVSTMSINILIFSHLVNPCERLLVDEFTE